MSVKDLADAKEKYLTNNGTTLNLNCKIVLFYTLTKKSLLNSPNEESEHHYHHHNNHHHNHHHHHHHRMALISGPTKALNLNASDHLGGDGGGNERLFLNRKKNTTATNGTLKFKRNKLNTTVLLIDANKIIENDDRRRLTCWSNFEANKAIKCNTLLYDMKRLFKHSFMHDLIIRAPVCVDNAAISYGLRVNNDSNSNAAADDDNDSEIKQFKAHKIVLAARSEVFEKMLNNNTTRSCSFEHSQQEKHDTVHGLNRSVSVLDIVDFDAFTVEIFLNFLYTDTLEMKFNNISLELDQSYNKKKKSLDRMKIYNRNEYRQYSEESENDTNSSSSGSESDENENGNDDDIDDDDDNENDNDNDNDDDDDDEDDYEKFLKAEFVTHIYIQLYKIADKYSVNRLKKMCESQLLGMINSETLVELLVLSYLHGSSKLKRKCLDYLSENLSKVLDQPAWSHMEKFYPALLAEVFRTLYFRQINYGMLN
jgi:hypothetical protein